MYLVAVPFCRYFKHVNPSFAIINKKPIGKHVCCWTEISGLLIAKDFLTVIFQTTLRTFFWRYNEVACNVPCPFLQSSCELQSAAKTGSLLTKVELATEMQTEAWLTADNPEAPLITCCLTFQRILKGQQKKRCFDHTKGYATLCRSSISILSVTCMQLSPRPFQKEAKLKQRSPYNVEKETWSSCPRLSAGVKTQKMLALKTTRRVDMHIFLHLLDAKAALAVSFFLACSLPSSLSTQLSCCKQHLPFEDRA